MFVLRSTYRKVINEYNTLYDEAADSNRKLAAANKALGEAILMNEMLKKQKDALKKCMEDNELNYNILLKQKNKLFGRAGGYASQYSALKNKIQNAKRLDVLKKSINFDE